MTLKEYLQDKTLLSVQYTHSKIFNVITNDGLIGLNIDTTDIESGLILSSSINFTYQNDILEVDGIQIDSNLVSIL